MSARGDHAHLAGTAALFLLVSVIPATTAAVLRSEGDALLTWKASLVDAAALSNWTSITPVCHWAGVFCSGHGANLVVTALMLGGLGLSGGLDTLDIAVFPQLGVLDLNGNNLGGNIPASIVQLRNLEMLDLSNNRFNGSIPPQLGDMPNLTILKLYNNSLAGSIPHHLCRLRPVYVLDISNNRLTGELLDCLCGLQSLGLIDLSNNQLTGELPGCWWNLQRLQFMDLSNNFLSGKIRATVVNHGCYINSLYLAGNGFVGAFPLVLGGCNSLETLDIGNNGFSGVIPPWIKSRLPLLKIFSLRSNNFTGEIPPGISGLSQLQLLDMADNSFAGSIPADFGSLTSMKHPQNLSKNMGRLVTTKYDDRIDIVWKGKHQIFQRAIQLLAGIDLSGNLLSRCIPEELTNLQGLRFLNLSRNNLSCGIPQDIGSLNFLESLDLSSNELTGAIPPSISSLTELSTLNVSSNHLSGKIPAGSQIQTLTDPSIYSNNSGLCGFPLDIPCTNTSLAPDEKHDEENDHWMYYSVIAGIVSGFWLWFGMLFTVKAWRSAFLFFVDGMQCKIIKKLCH